MNRLPALLITVFVLTTIGFAQSVQDDFEGNGNITTWHGDDCGINTDYSNPFSSGINTSSKVLEYRDNGGTYANVRFDASSNFNTSTHSVFSFKIYVPSSGLTGSQPNQVSLKLQNGGLGAPWSTQSEIIKTIQLDQWQILSFDFANDNYINLDDNSLPPTQRSDFNRVLIQVNGENNSDQVVAYIDDFMHMDTTIAGTVFGQLIWSDEFDVDGAIDDTKWFHQTKLPNGNSWYNGEIQHYTDEDSNAYVSDGILHLTARKETYTNEGVTKDYTSARLNSKFAFTYGRIEVRAKLPTGVGTWPAIWTLGKNISEPGAYWQEEGFGTTSWPACGEMDIMEHWGHNQNHVSSATHTPSSSGNTVNVGSQNIPTVSTEFHVYALEWTEDKLVFSVDEVVHFTYNPEDKNASTWPFTADQYILLNIAIQPSITSSFTKGSMDIDYVRVYKQSSVSTQTLSSTVPHFYPNPVNNELHIQLNNVSHEPIAVNIYDLTGKLIKSESIVANGNSLSIKDLNYLTKGMYFIDFKHDESIYNLKVLKN